MSTELSDKLKQMSLRARVRMGACELDLVRPNWFNQIDAESLDLESSCNCVLAQLDNGDYVAGCEEVFGVSGMGGRVGTDLVAASGFVTFGDETADDPYEQMTEFWKQEIRARKRAAKAVKEFNILKAKLDAGEISRWVD